MSGFKKNNNNRVSHGPAWPRYHYTVDTNTPVSALLGLDMQSHLCLVGLVSEATSLCAAPARPPLPAGSLQLSYIPSPRRLHSNSSGGWEIKMRVLTSKLCFL